MYYTQHTSVAHDNLVESIACAHYLWPDELSTNCYKILTTAQLSFTHTHTHTHTHTYNLATATHTALTLPSFQLSLRPSFLADCSELSSVAWMKRGGDSSLSFDIYINTCLFLTHTISNNFGTVLKRCTRQSLCQSIEKARQKAYTLKKKALLCTTHANHESLFYYGQEYIHY